MIQIVILIIILVILLLVIFKKKPVKKTNNEISNIEMIPFNNYGFIKTGLDSSIKDQCVMIYVYKTIYNDKILNFGFDDYKNLNFVFNNYKMKTPEGDCILSYNKTKNIALCIGRYSKNDDRVRYFTYLYLPISRKNGVIKQYDANLIFNIPNNRYSISLVEVVYTETDNDKRFFFGDFHHHNLKPKGDKVTIKVPRNPKTVDSNFKVMRIALKFEFYNAKSKTQSIEEGSWICVY